MFLSLNLKLHFYGEDAKEVLNLGDREISRKKMRMKQKIDDGEESPERGLFTLLSSQVSPSGGLPFPLTGLTSSCFGQPIMPFKPSILEDLAILPHV